MALLRRNSFLSTVLVLLLSMILTGCRRAEPSQSAITTPDAAVDPWQDAMSRVEQDRGEPMGRQAKVDVPPQLKLYEDSRLFLALQIAEAAQQQFHTPHDFADLVSLINRQELVELPPLGKDYILYGVGMIASDEPFTHYDKESHRSVTIYGSDDELQQEYLRITSSLKEQQELVTLKQKELKITPRRDREGRRTLETEIATGQQSLGELKQRKTLLDSFYQVPQTRQLIASEYETLATAARSFGGTSYSLQDPASRKAFKVRLLSYLRPAALRMLESLAQSYKERFGRPLAVTSLIRPDEYQHQLRETNRNATQVEVPPHTTGLAFDVYYRYMNAAEQEFTMGELSRLHDEGRIEALRETTNHFHVFVFTGERPRDEALIKKTLDLVPERTVQRPNSKSRSSWKQSTKTTRGVRSKHINGKGR
jgi:hypothetical protein